MQIAVYVLLAVQLPSAPAAAAHDLPARIESLVTRDAVEADGSTRRTVEARISLRNAAGVAQFGHLALPYVAGVGAVSFDAIEVVKPDGTRVPVRDPVTEDINPFGMTAPTVPADFRIRSATIPGLAVGDVLAYRATIRHAPLYRDAFFGEHKFIVGPVAAGQVYELDLPASLALRVRLAPGFPAKWEEVPGPEGRRVRRLVLTAPLPMPAEDATREEVERAMTEPDVTLTSFASWDAVGRWWWTLASDRFRPDEAIRAEAARLVAGKPDARARAVALHAFVAAQVRYVNVAFAAGRLQPASAPEVLANRYADCKGKHALLAALGAAAGLDVVPVLVHSVREELDDEAPSPTQFDHLVSVVRLARDPSKWLWVDATHDTWRPGHLPAVLRGKRALLVDASGGRIVTTPERPPFTATARAETTGAIDPSGPIRARVRWTLRNDAEPILRNGVRMVPRDKLIEVAKPLARAWTKGKLSDVATSDPANLDEPFRIEYAVEHTMGAQTFAKDWTLWVPMPDMELPKAEDGPVAATLPDEDELHFSARIEMPEGMKARAPLSVTLDRPFAHFRSTYAVEGRALVVERVLRVRERAIDAARRADYEAFRAAVEADQRQQFPIEAMAAPTPALDTADALNDAALKALDAGDYARAETLLRQATEKDPSHKWAWNNLGRALRKQGRLEEALAAYDRQIAINPFDTWAHGNRGSLLAFELDRPAEGEKSLLKQIEVAPLESYAYGQLGHMRTLQRRFAEAAELLEKAAAIRKDDPDTWLRLAFARARAGSGDVAAAVERVRAGTPSVRKELIAARALAVAGDLAAAARLAEAIRPALLAAITKDAPAALARADPSHDHDALYVAEAWRLAGAAALAAGDSAKAARFLSAAFELGALPEAAADLGRLHEKEGRREEAIRLWQRAAILPHWRANPARVELERAVKDRARLDALMKAAPTELAAPQLLALPGRAPAAGVKVAVRLLVDEDGRVLDVAATEPGDAARLEPLRARVVGLTLPGKAPEPGTLRILRPAMVGCFTSDACHLALPLLGERVARELER